MEVDVRSPDWSGDLGDQDDEGYLFLVDRAKDMISSEGENVYSVEVENALMSHPSVVEAAVIGVPDEQWGERVHAVVVARAGAEPSADDLIAHCKQQIASFKCPGHSSSSMRSRTRVQAR